MRKRPFIVAMLSAAIVAAPLLVGATGCSTPRICAGQCGPPFQLQVTFHTVIGKQAASAIMRNCANSIVERIGPVRTVRYPGDSPPVWLAATIYTTSMARRAENDALITCLRRSHAVIGAGYPD